MNDKEQFEDTIASKFAEAEFPFYEGNWDAAEEMIDAHRKKEKKRRFFYIFSAGIAIGILIMLPFVYMINDNTGSQLAQIETSSSESTPIGEASSNEIFTTPEPSFTPEPNAKIVEKVVVAAQSIVVTNASEKIIKRVNKVSDVITEKVNSPKTENILSKLDDIINKETASTGESFINTNKNEPKPSLLAFAKRKFNVNQIAADTPDSLFNLMDHTDFESSAMKIPMPWEVTAGIGGNFVQNFSFNPIQGIEITKPFTSHFAIGVGAYYTYLSDQSGGVKKITTETNYTFGYESDITEIETNKLHYVVIPFYFKYSLNDNNAFIAGANTFALFTSSNIVTTYLETDGTKEDETSEKTSGYSNGINSYDIGLLFGYKRSLFGNFGASLYFNYGLMDIKKDDYYQENNFERNLSGQIMLTYKL